MMEADMESLAGWMIEALRNPDNESHLNELATRVKTLCLRFPVPGLTS